MLKFLTKFRKAQRKEKNYESIKPIYDRGGMSFPKEYLTCHQESDPVVVEKLKAAAQVRREQRAERRLRNAGK